MELGYVHIFDSIKYLTKQCLILKNLPSIVGDQHWSCEAAGPAYHLNRDIS